MEAAAADLLAALSSPSSHAGLHSRCAAYLQPFTPYLPAANPNNPKPPPKRATKQSKQPPPPDAATLRPLAKRFLSFIARALQLLPPLVRARPASDGGGPDELLEIYGLLLDCLEVISLCLAGKPYSVLLQRGRFVCLLESRGHLARANAEAIAALDALRSSLSPPTTSTKSRRGAATVAPVLLPDPGSAGDAGRDPEVTTLAVELTVCLANCASKGKVMEAAAYERVLSLAVQLQPWLRILADDVSKKYLALLVNAMSRCTLFLVAESSFFSTGLVLQFCVSTIDEYVKAQMIERLPAIARKVCYSVDFSWEGSTELLLRVLKNVTDSIIRVKADSPKAVNEFLVFVACFSRSVISNNRDLCVGASELLFKRGGHFCEVSSPTTTVLLLYATGLYLCSHEKESDMRPSLSVDIFNNQKYLQALDKAAGSLAQMSDDSVSVVTYIDSLEFVCKVLLPHANAVWKNFSEGETINYSGNLDYVLRTMHQFIDSSLVAYSSAKMSEGDSERLLQQRGTLLRVFVSTLKMEFVSNKDIKKSLDSIKCAISSKWLTLEELKFLISSLGNIGVALYNTGHVKEAPKALELCCQTIWAHIRLSHSRLLSRTEANGTKDLPEDTLKDTILDAFSRIARMVDTLHRCGSELTRGIVAQSLSDLLADGYMSEYFDSSLKLIKFWVKATCKDFEANQVVDSAPLLYQYLLRCSYPLPKKVIGLIVEQELLAYGLMEARGSNFCAEMQIRVIDVLLDKIYYSKEHCLERSRFLVRKAGALRACGAQNIKSCLESLSEAISLLRTISEDSSQSNTTVLNQFAIALCLHAHCELECNSVNEVILENISSALMAWSKVETFDYSSSGTALQSPSETIVPLLCSLVDLLAIKGCFNLQFDLCELMVKIWKQESLPVEKLFSMLFVSGRLSHAYCHIPLDKQFISKAADHLGVDCHHTKFWRNCFEGERPSLSMFLQRMLPSDLSFPQSWQHSFGKPFSFDASVDEVNKTAISLISEATSNGQSNFLAGYLYYDLSERLFSHGQLFQAFSYGKEALHLRKKLLTKKFKLNFGSSGNMESHVSSLEAWGQTMAEIWPDSSKSTSTRESFLTSWSVLRCYLESTLQVAMMHELIGNGTEAEVLLRTGKEISKYLGLSILCIAFTSSLGQLYSRRQLWDEAKSELKNARDLLVEHDAIISCKLCKLTLDISVDMKDGDWFWNLFENDFQKQSTVNLSSALDMYRSAMEKLNSADMEFLTGPFDSLKTSCHVCNKDCTTPAENEVCNSGKEPLALKDDMLPPCSVCLFLRQASMDHCNDPSILKVRRKNSRNAEAGPPLNAAKRTSRNLSCSAKEQNAQTNAKTRTRSSKRTADLKGDKATIDLTYKTGTSWGDDLPADALFCGESDCIKDDLCNMFGCWKCLLTKSLNSGCIQSILQFRWDRVRRRYLVSLLLKIARAMGSRKGYYGDHEVHSVYWQCISLLFFRSFPPDCYRIYEPHLVGLIMGGSTGDFLPLEHAEILCSMSFILLKSSLPEQSRNICCCFSSVGISDVVLWLLKASVLSRESPSLFQEVCKLLACTFLLTTTDSSIHLPLCSNEKGFSLNRWAAYFHQMSVGTYHSYHHLASFQALLRENLWKDTFAVFRSEPHEDVSEFLRFPSMIMNHFEKHINEFFDKLPDVPVVCISMIGGDYVDVIEGFLLLPSSFPAWMLLSRFDSAGEPTTMLLPVAAISAEKQSADSSIKDLDRRIVSDKKWQCPWGYTITDYVAPTFKNILEENFMSLSSATVTVNSVQADHVRWWSHRMKLNNYLDSMLKDMEKSWFGPWKCLLLGHQLSDQNIDAASSSIMAGLDAKKIVFNPVLIKAILCGALSVDEVQECVDQLILYKGYFGRGGSCRKDRFRALSSSEVKDEDLEILKCIITNAVYELPEAVDKNPVILVLDVNVQMLPWENLPVLRNQEIYRMPSMGSIILALSQSNNHYKDVSAKALPFPVVDPSNTFYLLNPSGDLSSTQEEFHQLFRNYEWKGMAGTWDELKAKELVLALTKHDLFLYFGHGSGTQYVSVKEIEKLKDCAAALLMGCSSGTLHCKGSYAPRGAPLSYLSAGSPAIVANLWDVSDKDIDRFSKALLNSWLQENFTNDNNCSQCCLLRQEFESMHIASKDNGRTRRKCTRGKKPQQINDSSKCCRCRQRRMASYLSEARQACRLPFLIGAAPVCYGVPTIIRKKIVTDSTTGDER